MGYFDKYFLRNAWARRLNLITKAPYNPPNTPNTTKNRIYHQSLKGKAQQTEEVRTSAEEKASIPVGGTKTGLRNLSLFWGKGISRAKGKYFKKMPIPLIMNFEHDQSAGPERVNSTNTHTCHKSHQKSPSHGPSTDIPSKTHHLLQTE
jgi:hypothetical protein